MKAYTTDTLRQAALNVRAGDEITLSGIVYTARDAAHKKITGLIESGSHLPFKLSDAYIYFAGPTPAPAGKICGSFGPTTSCRMDSFTPALMDRGLFATIGKGGRSDEVKNSIIKNKGLYLLAIGGAGAIAARHITDIEEIAFHELGCESIKKVVFNEFPLYVGIDTHGNTLI